MKRCCTLLVLLTGLIPNISRAQTQPQILAELFGNFGCTNCRPDDDKYSTYIAAHPTYGIVVINYHNNFPELSDKFYHESQADVDSRDGSSYYNVSGDPTAFIDGVVSQSSPQFQWNTTTEADHNSPLIPIVVSASYQPDGLVHVAFSVTGPASGPSKVYVALKESRIYYANTFSPGGYGNPPDSLWDNIFRTMLPSATGSASLAASQAMTFDIVYNPSNHPGWNIQNMDAVVFVQDVNADPAGGFDVESLGVVRLANLSGIASTSDPSTPSICTIGNPSSPQLRLTLPTSSRVTIALYDLLGREIRTLVDGMMPAGETSVEMEASTLPAGCYVARLTLDGHEAGHAKFVAAP